MRFTTIITPLSGILFLLVSSGVARAQVLSMHPLVTDEDAVLEPAIIGHWDDIEITQRGKTEYEACTNNNDEPCVRFRLARLAGEIFADAWFDIKDLPALPVHFFARLRLVAEELRISLMDADWLGDEVKRPQFPVHGALD